MKNIPANIMFVILTLVFSGATFAQDNAKAAKTDLKSTKKSVAVLNFNDASLGNKELSLGKYLVESVTKELIKTKAFNVIEKQQIDEVMKELVGSLDEAMDPKTAAKVGKRVAANTVIFGTINEYNIVGDEVVVLGVRKTKYTATVGLSIRLVDINTGLILESVDSTETAKKETLGITNLYDKTQNSDFKIKLFTEAADKAAKAVVKQLSPVIQKGDTALAASQTSQAETTTKPAAQTKTSTTTPTREVSSKTTPKIIRIIKEIVYISGLQGVKIGDLLSVVRGTGDGKEIAVIEVTEVTEGSVKAKIIDGGGILQTDRVKVIQ